LVSCVYFIFMLWQLERNYNSKLYIYRKIAFFITGSYKFFSQIGLILRSAHLTLSRQNQKKEIFLLNGL
jgi:hypothetical protein